LYPCRSSRRSMRPRCKTLMICIGSWPSGSSLSLEFCVFYHLTEGKHNQYLRRRKRRDCEETVIKQQFSGLSTARKHIGHKIALRVVSDVRKQHAK
jgi:hypothetical protein